MSETFSCGCPKKITMNDLYTMKFDCPKVWRLISSGRTTGVFQFESDLGQSWCDKIQAQSIRELADISSIIRPGAANARDEVTKKNMTTLYWHRKIGKDDCASIHEAIDDIVVDTYNVLCYQEQIMRIAQRVAGFTESDADGLRKVVGKKQMDKILAMRGKFIDGVNKTGIISEELGNKLYDWIEKSGKYLFNKSHACQYSMISYWTAYMKTHYPVHFYHQWLKMAHEKIDTYQEVRNLIVDGRSFNIEFLPPNVLYSKPEFSIENNKIRFGLTNIKNVGNSHIAPLMNIQWTRYRHNWTLLLVEQLANINIRATKALISVGAFSDISNLSRTRMLFELDKLKELNDTELAFAQKLQQKERFPHLWQLFAAISPTKKEGGIGHTAEKSKILSDMSKMLRNPPSTLDDDPLLNYNIERDYLGIAMNYSLSDVYDGSVATHTCRDIVNGTKGKDVILMVEVEYVKVIKTKKDRYMAFVKGGDGTARLSDITVFSDEYDMYGSLLRPNSVIYISCDVLESGIKCKKIKTAKLLNF